MPHLRFRAVEPQAVQALSKPLTDELQPLMDCPREDFTFEYIYSTFFSEGEVSAAYPFVEVLYGSIAVKKRRTRLQKQLLNKYVVLSAKISMLR